MSAATTTSHLAHFLSNPLFCSITGLHSTMIGHTKCDVCKSIINNELSSPDAIFHMIFGLLKITHSLHDQLQKLTQQISLNPPSTAPLNC